MWKKFFYLFSVVSLLGLVGYVYINKVFLPVQLRDIVNTWARNALHRDIGYRDITYRPFQGFIIQDLTIYRRDDPQIPFAQADEVRFNVLIAPLIQKQQVIIPSVILVKPFIQVIRGTDRQWNFSDLVNHQERPEGKKKTPGLILGRLTIKEGQVEITDLSLPAKKTEILKDITFISSFSLSKGISFSFHTALNAPAATVDLTGQFSPSSRTLRARLKARNCDLTNDLSLLPLPERLSFNTLFLARADVDVQYRNASSWQVTGDLEMPLDLQFQDQVFKGTLRAQKTSVSIDKTQGRLNGNLALEQGAIRLNNSLHLRGDLALQAQDSTFAWGQNQWTLKGQATLNPAGITLGDDKNLTGQILLDTFEYQQQQQNITLSGGLTLTQAQFTDGKSLLIRADTLTTPLSLKHSPGQTTLMLEPACGQCVARLAADQVISGPLQMKNTRLTFSEQDFAVLTSIHTENLQGQFGPDLQLAAAADADLSVEYHPLATNPLSYNGTVRLAGATLTGVPRAGTLNNLAGTLNLATNRVESPKLIFETLGSRFTASGTVSNFKDPFAGITLKAYGFDLARLKDIIPEHLSRHEITPQGAADIKLTLTGRARALERAQLDVSARLDQAAFSSPRWPAPLTGVSGLLQYTEERLYWENLNVTFQDKTCILNGRMINFEQPSIATKISSEDLQAQASFQVAAPDITVSSLAGTFRRSSFDIQGRVRLKENRPPSLELTSSFNLDTEDLAFLPALIKEKTAPYQLKGLVEGQIEYSGSFVDGIKAVREAHITGPALSVKGYTLKDLTADYRTTASLTGKLTARARFYDGTLTLSSSVDWNDPGLGAAVNLDLSGTNLAKIRDDAGWKKETAGTLSLQLNAAGPLNDTKAIQGEGRVSIIDGQLWTLSLLQGLGKMLFIPEYKGIIFTEGRADFTLKDNRIATQNLILKSTPMDLAGTGWVDLNQDIHLDIIPRFRETEILLSDSLKKVSTAFLSQTDGYLTIKISGTLQKPVYKTETLPGKVIEKATGTLIEGVQGLIEGILQ